MKSQWLTHSGKRVFCVDFSNMDAAAFRAEGEDVVRTLTREPLQSVLSLVDVQGTFGTADIMDAMKDVALKTKPHVRRRAILGVTGVKKILLNTFNQFLGQETVAFDSKEKALDWLVKD